MDAIERKRFINSDDQRIYDNLFDIFSNFPRQAAVIKHLQLLHSAIEKGFLLMYFGGGGVLFKVIGVPKLLKITYNDKEANIYKSLKETAREPEPTTYNTILKSIDMPFYQDPVEAVEGSGREAYLVNSITQEPDGNKVLIEAMKNSDNSIFSVVCVKVSAVLILSWFDQNLIKLQILDTEIENGATDYNILCMPFLGFDLLSYLLKFSYAHFNHLWIAVEQPSGHLNMEIPQFVILCRSLHKFSDKLKKMHNILMFHRDIKPNNIIYDELSGQLTLIDFDQSVYKQETEVDKFTNGDLSTFINLVVLPVMYYGIRNKEIYEYLTRTNLLFYIETFSIKVMPGKNDFDTLMQQLAQMTHAFTSGASLSGTSSSGASSSEFSEYLPDNSFKTGRFVDKRTQLLAKIKDACFGLEQQTVDAYIEKNRDKNDTVESGFILRFLYAEGTAEEKKAAGGETAEETAEETAGGGIKRKNKISKKYRKLNEPRIRRTKKRLTK